jgi:hypothetical protein
MIDFKQFQLQSSSLQQQAGNYEKRREARDKKDKKKKGKRRKKKRTVSRATKARK